MLYTQCLGYRIVNVDTYIHTYIKLVIKLIIIAIMILFSCVTALVSEKAVGTV